MRINHCRAHIFVAEKFLHGSNIVAAFEQMRREGMPQRMTRGRFREGGRADSILDCRLQNALRHVMALHVTRSWIDAQTC